MFNAAYADKEGNIYYLYNGIIPIRNESYEWGDVNRLMRGIIDLAIGGGPDILHATYGEFEEDGRLKITDGDSYVLLVIWDKDGNVHSMSVHQFGSATLDEDSPHYADQAPILAQRQLKPVWFDEAEIRKHLEAEYVPGEEC